MPPWSPSSRSSSLGAKPVATGATQVISRTGSRTIWNAQSRVVTANAGLATRPHLTSPSLWARVDPTRACCLRAKSANRATARSDEGKLNSRENFRRQNEQKDNNWKRFCRELLPVFQRITFSRKTAVRVSVKKKKEMQNVLKIVVKIRTEKNESPDKKRKIMKIGSMNLKTYWKGSSI